jgi:hypothetical protein
MAPGMRPIGVLLFDAQRALKLNQEGLGKLLGGVSRRTVWRYQGGRSSPQPHHFHALARHVFPTDKALAEQLAAVGGATLETLGLVVPAPAPAKVAPSAPLPPAPTPIDPMRSRLLVDAVVCAAAEALDVSPRSVRGALYAAFARAKETGLSIDAIEASLAPPAAAAAKPDGKSKTAPAKG